MTWRRPKRLAIASATSLVRRFAPVPTAVATSMTLALAAAVAVSVAAAVGRSCSASQLARRPLLVAFPKDYTCPSSRIHTLCSLQCYRPYEFDLPGHGDTCATPLVVSGGTFDARDADRSDRLRDAVDDLGGLLAGRLVKDVALEGDADVDVTYCTMGEEGTKRPGPMFLERALVNQLMLYRNSLGGSVVFGRGKYQVLSVNNAVLGVCLDATCSSAAAVDTTRSSPLVADEANRTHMTTPILTLAASDGVQRPVSMSNRGLLSLGRAVLQSTDWLRSVRGTFGVNATIRLSNKVPVAVSVRGADGTATRSYDFGMMWRLDGSVAPSSLSQLPLWNSSNNGTTWLAGFAMTMCEYGTPFMNDKRLCAGYQDGHPEEEEFLGAYVEAQNRHSSTGSERKKLVHDLSYQRKSTWSVHPHHYAASDQDSADLLWPADGVVRTVSEASMAQLDEIRLRDTPREINVRSQVEAKLARALRQRLVRLPATISPASGVGAGTSRLSVIRDGHQILQTAARILDAQVSALAGVYDKSVWNLDEPAEPARVADMVLAAIISLPEVGGLVAMWLTGAAASWDVTRACVFLLLLGLGVVSLSEAWRLAAVDRAGHAWRASAQRSAILARLPRAIDVAAEPRAGLAGAVVVQHESVLVIARDDYRPATTAAVAVFLTLLYVVVALPLLARVLYLVYLRLERRKERNVREEQQLLA